MKDEKIPKPSEEKKRAAIERQVGRIKDHAENKGQRMSYDQARAIAVRDQKHLDKKHGWNK